MSGNDRISASWLLIAGSAALAYWFFRLPSDRKKALFGQVPQSVPTGIRQGGSSGVGELRLREAEPIPRAREQRGRYNGQMEFSWPLKAMDAFSEAIRRGKMKSYPGSTPGINPSGYYDPESELSRSFVI